MNPSLKNFWFRILIYMGLVVSRVVGELVRGLYTIWHWRARMKGRGGRRDISALMAGFEHMYSPFDDFSQHAVYPRGSHTFLSTRLFLPHTHTTLATTTFAASHHIFKCRFFGSSKGSSYVSKEREQSRHSIIYSCIILDSMSMSLIVLEKKGELDADIRMSV
jgi:hypothetical protein